MILISQVKACFKPGSVGHWILSGFYHSPMQFPFALLRSLICTKKLCGNYWPIKVRVAAGQKFKIQYSPSRNVQLEGILSVGPWGCSNSSSSLTLGSGSRFVVSGNFDIGPGVHISVGSGASLRIGGRLNDNASGITSDTRIMVEQSVEIGYGCIIAWDVFISDSDWHDIKGMQRSAPVVIGNRVWIAHGVSILKGTIIPSGCIVGAKSMVSSVIKSEQALVAGNPAVVIRTGVEWSR
jgi:acetyltransferase-like isoleucine patch superfamily enzyme